MSNDKIKKNQLKKIKSIQVNLTYPWPGIWDKNNLIKKKNKTNNKI
jgi:hypothetical protein